MSILEALWGARPFQEFLEVPNPGGICLLVPNKVVRVGRAEHRDKPQVLLFGKALQVFPEERGRSDGKTLDFLPIVASEIREVEEQTELRLLGDPPVKGPCNDHESSFAEAQQAWPELTEKKTLANPLRNRCVTWGAIQQADPLMTIECRVLDSEQKTNARYWQSRRHERECPCTLQLSNQPRCTEVSWHCDERNPDENAKY